MYFRARSSVLTVPAEPTHEGLDAEAGVVDGAGWRGKVEDEVNLAGIERLADVLLHKAEAGFSGKMAEIGRTAGAEIVHSDDGMSLRQAERHRDGSRESLRLR